MSLIATRMLTDTPSPVVHEYNFIASQKYNHPLVPLPVLITAFPKPLITNLRFSENVND